MASLETTPLATTPVAARHRFELNLEALRGFAALVVIFHHVLINKFSLDPAYTPTARWMNPLPGHSSVLLFFILSGYVIGLANPQALTWHTVGPYLRKRLVRLYPIYFVSLLLTLLAIKKPYLLTTIAANFLFLQNSVAPYIFENNPLWSLNYEMLYYLAFIPISALGLRAGWVSSAGVVLGLVFGTLLPLPLLSSYCFGFVFWASGLWLAQAPHFRRHYASPYLLGGLLFIFLGYESLNPFMVAEQYAENKLAFHLAELSTPGIPFFNLLHWPFCFCLFCYFANYTFRQSKLLLALIVLSGYAYFFHLLLKYGVLHWQIYYLLLPILFLTIGTGLLLITHNRPRFTNNNLLPTWLLRVGAISYGIYTIHFPISILLSHIKAFSGSAFSFSIRLVFDLVLVLAGSYLLELKFQPWIKTQLASLQSTHT